MNLEQECHVGGTVDVHAHMKIHACMGRRLTPSVGRLTVLHVFVVGVVRLQDAWSDRSRLRRYVHTVCGARLACVRLVGVVRLQLSSI